MCMTERHFPPFIVRLIDVNTGQVHSAANDWCVLFHLYDGYGRLVDEKLADDKVKFTHIITTHHHHHTSSPSHSADSEAIFDGWSN